VNKLIAILVVAGALVLGGPHLLNADHPPVHGSGDAPTTVAAFPETSRLPETTRPSVVSTVTSTTIPVVTTTVVPVDTQEVAYPVIQALPYETPRWRIDYRIDTGQHLHLVITLMTLVNRADQVSERRAQLVEAKAEALAWLMERGGVKPSTYPITWFPSDAVAL
jgi:hypothetical protein